MDLRSARNCFTLFSQAVALGGASVCGQYPSGHSGETCLELRLNSRMSHCAMRMCSSRRQAVCGCPSGFLPRSRSGKSFTTASNFTCAFPPLQQIEKVLAHGLVMSVPLHDGSSMGSI